MMFARRVNGLSVDRLSALTWSAVDRVAWLDAYRAARRIASARNVPAPLAVLRAVTARNVENGGAIYEVRAADVHSVHVDVLTGGDS